MVGSPEMTVAVSTALPPLNFHGDSRFTYNPNFYVDSLHQQPQSPGIPHGICEILPAGTLQHILINLAVSSFKKTKRV